jgi:hypothetical protein
MLLAVKFDRIESSRTSAATCVESQVAHLAAAVEIDARDGGCPVFGDAIVGVLEFAETGLAFVYTTSRTP